MWYRKTFALPAAWSSKESSSSAGLGESSVWIEFDGIFHAAIVYLNGRVVARNAEGYLGFQVPIDNTTGALRSAGEKNVLAIFVDPDGGAGFSSVARSGWWYEGAGIYRHARIVRSTTVRIAQNGLVARSEITPSQGTAQRARLTAIATVENAGVDDIPSGVHVSIIVVEKSSGIVVGSATSTPLGLIQANSKIDASAVVVVQSPTLWGPHNPALYDVVAKVVAADGKHTLDSVNVTHGFRELTFSGAEGAPSCTLNGKPFKWRGFCDVRVECLTQSQLYHSFWYIRECV
jgi:beta-galactosidase